MNNIILAHIIIEAKTALHCGGGEANALQDSPIMRDFNALPVILGTSICGVLRAQTLAYFKEKFGENAAQDKVNSLFGYAPKKSPKAANSAQNDKSPKDCTPSKLIFSNALLLDENLQVCESLKPKTALSPFLQHFLALPQRQHNAINAQGVCVDGAKYDEEVVFRGSRFKFSLEMRLENEADEQQFFELSSLFCADDFRLGASSSKGLGRIAVADISYEIFAANEAHKFSASLNEILSQKFTPRPTQSANFLRYELDLRPESVFIFGSGYGDEDADSVGVSEPFIDYERGKLGTRRFLIPASSVKGALSHRTMFYINENLGNFIDKKPENSQNSVNFADKNAENALNLDDKAAKIHATLFGSANSSNKGSAKAQNSTTLNAKSGANSGKKGAILISDIYLNDTATQIFAHNSIDRFSGAAINGALFQEKVNFQSPQNSAFRLEISVRKCDTDEFQAALKAFEKALLDLCASRLPLGAMSSKGHGFFVGEARKDGQELRQNEREVRKNGGKL